MGLSPLTRIVTNLERHLLSLSNRDFAAHTPPAIASVRDVVSRGGTIGDRVWLDVDGDGAQDVGEPGLGNIELTLYNAGVDMMVGGGDDTVVSTMLSGANGSYVFTHVPPGTYYVDVTDATVPSGLTSSPGTPDPSATVTVTAEEIFVDLDFGYTNTAATAVIGDRVWSDANQDGILDPGEVGIGGVSVELHSAGADGILGTGDDVLEDRETTAVDGSYLFTGVAAGDYIVTVDESSVALTGYSFRSGPQSVSNPSPPLTVAAGNAYLNADFAYFKASTYSISDRVWSDSNEDGVQASFELGIAGVVVNLVDLGADMAVGGGDDRVITSVTTDANGDFSFSGVENGSYNIEIADTDGVLSGFGGTTQPGRDFELGVTVAGSDISAVSFGYNGAGRIGDTVWSDSDGDGVHDPGEPGIAGVSVELWSDTDGDGVFDNTVDTLLDTKITGDAGTYLFEGLVTGTFFVSIDDTQANLIGYTPTTTDDESGGNAPGTQIEVTLSSLISAFLDADFGYQNTGLADVSGNVWEDLDSDGLDDGAGEPGIDGVTVALVSAAGVTVAATTTDAAGDYAFPDVAAGNYTVEITDAARRLDGYRLTSGLDQIPITVAATDVTGVDFGYVRTPGTGSIGDRVWMDGNRDGNQNGSEPGIGSVTVWLYDPGPDEAVGGGDDVLLATTTTDNNGNYRFNALSADNYFVDLDASTLPTGLSATTGTSDPTAVINLSDGQFYEDADFGYSSTTGSSIGDTVFYDADGSGIQEPGEVGIGGVTVIVDGPSGTFPVTTNADGTWLVPGLTAGTYTVTVDDTTLPAGYNTTPTNGPISRSYDVPLSSDVMHADFGFDGGTTGSIGDIVYLDTDGDGTQDAGELGIAGVTLELVDASSQIIAATTTAADGSYDFVGVPAGTYTVVVTDAFGALSGLNATESGGGPIVLAAGGDHNDVDFGYAPSGGAGSVGTIVWHDVDGNGVRDAGESGMEFVTLELWHDVNGDGVLTPGTDNLVRKAVTDVNGEYEIKSLPPGDYIVDVTDDNGVLADFTATSGTPDVNDNAQADPYSFTLVTSNLAADFGYEAVGPQPLSGMVFYDINADGTFNGFDNGIQNVNLFLFRDLDGDGVLDATDALIGTTIAAIGGLYSFSNLPDGDYIVSTNTGSSFLTGGSQTTQLVTAGVQPASIAGAPSVNNDFGFTLFATLAVISRFDSYIDGGQVIVEWETSSEVGTLGFYLHRWDPSLESYVQVNDQLLLGLIDAPQGGRYRLIDENAPQNDWLFYRVLEVEAGGTEILYGPFRTRPDHRLAMDKGPMETKFERRVRRGTKAARQRLSESRETRRTWKQLKRRMRRNKREAHRLQKPAVKLAIRERGLYFVSAAELATELETPLESIQRRIRSRRLALEHLARPVAWLPAPDASGIYFYGEPIDSIYTRENIYWLRLARGIVMKAVRDAAAPATSGGGSFPSSVDIEEDVFAATIASSDPDKDFWCWSYVSGGHPSFGIQSFDIPAIGLAQEGGSALLEMRLYGATDTQAAEDHHVVLRMNGIPIGEHRWDGIGDVVAAFEFPATLLQDGNNELELEATLEGGAPYSVIYIDGFGLRYPRSYRAQAGEIAFTAPLGSVVTLAGFTTPGITVLDVTDPRRPKRISSATPDQLDGHRLSFITSETEARYLALDATAVRTPLRLWKDEPSSLRDTRSSADYLVIAPEELLTGAHELAEYRRQQGMTTRVASLENIQDEFAHGLATPEAIRLFLHYAYHRWAGVPRYVVLVGKGTFGYTQQNDDNLLPTLLTHTPNGLFASDNLFADVVGNDSVPEYFLGRIPVLTNEELSSYVEKLTRHEASGGAPGRQRALLLADNADIGGSFTFASDRIAELLPESMETEGIYLSELSVADAREQLFAALSSGVSYVNYIGHGGLDRFAAESLLLTADIPNLESGEPFPIVASLTCTVGRFEIPGFVSLGETMVVEPDKGAVAVWAPSGLSFHSDAMILNEAFVAALYAEENVTIGQAVHEALTIFAKSGHMPFMLRIYNILGDPATFAR